MKHNFVKALIFGILIVLLLTASSPMQTAEPITAESLALVTGAILSLCFSYIPGLKDWFEPLENKYKQAIMGALLIVVAFAIYGLSCAAVFSYFTCDKAGFMQVVEILVFALIANQSIYLITKKG
jgi:multisubunit Na+/H+ antiporter MnhG subunit